MGPEVIKYLLLKTRLPTLALLVIKNDLTFNISLFVHTIVQLHTIILLLSSIYSTCSHHISPRVLASMATAATGGGRTCPRLPFFWIVPLGGDHNTTAFVHT